MKEVNVAVIGGGVIGTAVARQLSAEMKDIVLLESQPGLGQMTSTRNSGVFHGGVYYPPNSLKARFAIPGNRLSRSFCLQQGVPMKNCGKLITAAGISEIPQLEKLQQQGVANGVSSLEIIGPERIRTIEPNIRAVAALWVPDSCVVDATALVHAYARVAINQGATILARARVTALEGISNALVLHYEDSEPRHIERMSIAARCVINTAGLYADDVAALLEGQQRYHIYPLRGEYARICRSKAHLVNGLVYPLPKNDVLVRDAGSRRVHLTRTIHGDLLVGPTARYVDSKEDYDSNRISLEEFYAGVVYILRGVQAEDLELAHTGIRPQLLPPGGQAKTDYVIERSVADSRLINLIGIETPGLTAAPAIAEYVATMVRETVV